MTRRPTQHGAVRSYQNGCRCEACKAANATSQRNRRARAATDPNRADKAGHGKASTYRNHGCRCEACTAASTSYQNDYYERSQTR